MNILTGWDDSDWGPTSAWVVKERRAKWHLSRHQSDVQRWRQSIPGGRSSKYRSSEGCIFMKRTSPGYVWLLRPWNVVSETEKMNSAFHLMLINLRLHSHMGLSGCPLDGLFLFHAAFWCGRPVGFNSLWKVILFLSTWSPKTGQVWRIYWSLPQG